MKKIGFIIILTFWAAVAAFAQGVPAPPAADPADFISDGCTGFPDGNYYDCCVVHDREYYFGGSWKERWRSDKKLFRCVAAKPKFYNKLVAPLMWLGVRVGGVPWLKTRFRWGFGKNKKTPVETVKPEQKSTN